MRRLIFRKGASSVEKIPPEVLAEIFMFLCPMEVLLPPSKRLLGLDRYRYPWALGHVCTSWRDVLWASPKIWENIRIDHGGIGFFECNNCEERIYKPFLYIISTTQTLLSVRLKVEWGRCVSGLHTIVEHNHRFKSLTLHFAGQSDFFSLMDLPKHSFPNLEQLDVSWNYTDRQHPDQTSSCFQTAPSLRRVYFGDIGSDHNPRLLLLPWEQLTDIFITCMDIPPAIIHTILKHCQALVYCHFTYGTGAIPATNIILALPNLESLELISWRHQVFDWEGFLQPFFTPSLKHLKILTSQLSPQPLTSLITRSKCALETVTFRIWSHSIDELHSVDELHYKGLLKCLSTVTKFSGNWITPPSIISKIHDTLLPLLEESNWCLRPDGLEIFLDVLDWYAASSSKGGERRKVRMVIECLDGPGLEGVKDRYHMRFEVYQGLHWLDLIVMNEGTPLQYM
jgi:hypothetical protein